LVQSSLHGLKYISEDGRHWTERVLWLVLCLMGFVLNVYFIVPIWIKWNNQPTLTTLDSTNHPVWEIDFPAITICSPNKVVERKLESLANTSPWKEALRESSGNFEDLQELFEIVVKFRDPQVKPRLQKIIERSPKFSELLSSDRIADALIQVMPNCSDFIQECWWQGNKEDCNSIFELRKTDEGFCCSFNALRQSETIDLSSIRHTDSDDNNDGSFSKGIKSFQEEFFDNTNEEIVGMFDFLDWNEDKGNPENLNGDINKTYTQGKTNVRRVNHANYHRGLSLLVDIRSDDYFITTDDFEGVKLLVHDPSAYPELQSKALAIGSGQEVFVTTNAAHTDASNRIRNFAVSARNCLFDDERDEPNSQVTMFKFYSEENCLLECRARHLINRCGCLPYYYPRLDILLDFGQNNMTTCDWHGLQCLSNASDLLDSVKAAMLGLSNFDQKKIRQIDSVGASKGAECRCPPACRKTRYSSTFSSAKFPNKASRFYKLSNDRGADFDMTLVHVYFADLKMFRYITDELFSWQDILAAFGGLVGLCTGFSFLSAAEIVYFFTLRCALPICRRNRKGRLHPTSDSDHLVMVKVEE